MAEEFEESEVIFQEEEDDSDEIGNFEVNSGESVKRKRLTKMNEKDSVPVNIPHRNSWIRRADTSDLDGSDGELVPPHVIIGRRVAAKMMALSVCTGNGRTLKGRDLSHVRNWVLRMTGFLET